MSFKQDFVDELEKYQCLPISDYLTQAEVIKSKEDQVIEKDAAIKDNQKLVNDIQN